ncbi:hypothetical protein NEDG_00094 [Nematocida displodere]|uniref:Uncharacterized protein n=1 Tax=Nematocida displodere TaxID=1805483 RepID=A0A177EKV9_9MICR|nr:hypothetical protein NEDG_00094 [Nematocida displodere]
MHQYICIEPFLPGLKTLKCLIGNDRLMTLYKTNGILRIMPGLYNYWASGRLNKEIESVSKRCIYSTNNQTPTPFLPSKATQKSTVYNPCCFVCGLTVGGLCNPAQISKTAYVVIVCRNGHLACHPWLKQMAQEPSSE